MKRERGGGGERRNIIDTIGKYRNTVPAGEYRGDQFRGIHINFRCVVDPSCERDRAVRFLLLASSASLPFPRRKKKNAKRRRGHGAQKSFVRVRSVSRENLPTRFETFNRDSVQRDKVEIWGEIETSGGPKFF